MKRIFPLILILPLIFPTLSALAQQTAPVKHLTLRQCIENGVKEYTSVKLAQADSLEAALQVNVAKNAFLPTASAGIGQEFSFGRAEDATQVLRNESASSTSFQVSASYTIFSGLRRLQDLELAKQQLAATNNNYQAVKDQATLVIVGEFYQVLMLEEMVRLADANVEQTKSTLEYTKAMVNSGKWPKSKQLDLEAQLANELVSRIDSYNDLYQSRLTLTHDISQPTPESFTLVAPEIDKLVAIATEKVYSEEQVYKVALIKRSDVLVANQNIEIAQQQRKVALTGYIPTISLNVSWGSSYFYPFNRENRIGTYNFATQFNNNNRYFIGLSLSIPIFDALNTASLVKRSNIQKLRAEANYINVIDNLQKDIRSARANAENASKKIHLAEESQRTSQESLRITQDAFEAGRSTVLELEQAKNRAFAAELQLIRAKYDFVYKTTILQHYMGEYELW